MTRGFAHRRADLAVLLLLSAVTMVGAYVYSAGYHHLFWDDTYIALQYVKNLARGHGLVFNVGERVEGYTNFLWVLWLAPCHAVADATAADFGAMVRAWSLAFTLVNLWLTYAIARQLYGSDRVATLLPPLLVATDGATPFFAMIGMENAFQQTWLLLAFYLWVRRGRLWHLALGLALAMAVLTRLDSLIFVAVLLAMTLRQWLEVRRTPAGRRALGAMAITYGIVALLFGAHVLWRYYYYGYPLPNTFYVKATGGWSNVLRGLQYTARFVLERALMPVVALAGVHWIRTPWIAVCLLFSVLHTAYVVSLGGDFYAGSRFLVALAPFLYLVLGRLLVAWHDWLREYRPSQFAARRKASTATLLAFVLVVFVPIGLTRGAYQKVIRNQAALNLDVVDYARFIRSQRQPGDSIFAGRIGAIGYFGDVRVIDVYGLVDLAIAHEMVPIGGLDMPGHQKEALPEYGLWHEPTFIPHNLYSRDYRRDGYYLLARRPEGGPQPTLWKREDLPRDWVVPGTRIGFERLTRGRWPQTGSAFAHNPARGKRRGQTMVLGFRGRYLNSFHPSTGDAAVGTLTSPPFAIRGDLLVLDVGGGNEQAGQRVELEVDGQRVRATSGNNSEYLCRVVWDVSAHRGASARLRIIDRGAGAWGHIMVDSVRQLTPP